jgi:hypothetical protein
MFYNGKTIRTVPGLCPKSEPGRKKRTNNCYKNLQSLSTNLFHKALLYVHTEINLYANQKGNCMKQLIAIIATTFAATAFAADAPKAPVATPAVTKADAPVPAAKEAAKAPAAKSEAKPAAKADAKKAPEAAKPASGTSK